MKNRANAYQFTVDLRSGLGMDDVDLLRKELKGSGKRVVVRGRLGRNNPEYAKYRNRQQRYWVSIPLKDAHYADVYVY